MKTFINVAQMKLATLQAGQFVETGGYYTKGDTGAAKYLIVAAQAADGYGDHTLANGTVAVLQFTDIVEAKKFGVKVDGASDDTLAWQSVAARLYNTGVRVTGSSVYEGSGVYTESIISGQVNFNGVETDLYNLRFKLADNFPVSPAIYANTGSAANKSRLINLQVDGNKANQTNDNLVSIEIKGLNASSSDIRIGAHYSKIGLRVSGNTETTTINVGGASTDLLVSEGIDGTNTPDENIYNVSGNGCRQWFVQETAGQGSSGILNLNTEGGVDGYTEQPVVIRSTKLFHINGEMRTPYNGAVLIDGTDSLQVEFNLSVYAVQGNQGGLLPLKVNSCGYLNGKVTILQQGTADGCVWLKLVRRGGNFSITLTAFQGYALRLGDTDLSGGDATVDSMKLYLNANGGAAGSKTLVAERFRSSSIYIDNAYAEIDLDSTNSGLLLDSSYSLPSLIIDSDILVNVSARVSQIAEFVIRGIFTEAEILAYSSPFVGMKIAMLRNAGASSGYRPAIYSSVGGNGWKTYSLEAI